MLDHKQKIPAFFKEVFFVSLFFIIVWVIYEIMQDHAYPLVWNPPYGVIGGGDFFVFFSAGKFLGQHAPHLLYDVGALNEFQNHLLGQTGRLAHPWAYPPVFMPVAQGLSSLPFAVSYFVWMLGSALALVMAFRPFADRLPIDWKWAGIAAAIGAGGFFNLLTGQNGFLSAALLVGGFGLMDKRPIWAGILFGLLFYKPQLGVLIPLFLLIDRRWVCFVSAACCVLALVAVSALVYGVECWVVFFENMSEFSRIIFNTAADMMLRHITISLYNVLLLWGLDAKIGLGIHMVVAAMACMATLYFYARCKDMLGKCALILTTTILIMPYAIVYDMVLINAAVVLSAVAASKTSLLKGEKALLVIVWFLPFLQPLCVSSIMPVPIPVTPLMLGIFLIYQYARIHRKIQAC